MKFILAPLVRSHQGEGLAILRVQPPVQAPKPGPGWGGIGRESLQGEERLRQIAEVVVLRPFQEEVGGDDFKKPPIPPPCKEGALL